MKEFATHHPWMTFFLGLAAINGVVLLVRGRNDHEFGIAVPPPPSGPAKTASAVTGLFGFSPTVRSDAAHAVHAAYDWAR